MKVIKGSLIDIFSDPKYGAVINFTDCFGKMSVDYAPRLSGLYEDVYDADQDTSIGDYGKLGNISVAATPHGLVFNCYCYFNANSKLDFTSLRLCLRKIAFFLNDKSIQLLIGYPDIKTGKGKLEKMFLRELDHKKTTIVVFN